MFFLTAGIVQLLCFHKLLQHVFFSKYAQKTKKICFHYRGCIMDVKALYLILCRTEWSTKEKYPYSSIVTFNVYGQKLPVKLVFVTKHGDKTTIWFLELRKPIYALIISFNMYARRWQIEGYFKVG